MSRLQTVVFKGKLRQVKSLIRGGADVNEVGYDGRTLLHYAAERGHLNIAKELISVGAKVNTKDGLGMTPLLSFVNDDEEIAEVLISAGADVNAKNGSERGTPLHDSASKGHSKIVDVLIAAGADVNAKMTNGETAVHSSVQRGHLDIVRKLISAGADVNVKMTYGETALHRSVQSAHLDIVQKLISAGADVNAKMTNGETALHLSAETGDLDVVQTLISANPDINAKTSNGETALYRSVQRGHSNIVQILISAGADVNAKDKSGKTPLHHSVIILYEDMVKALIAAGADVNMKDSDGWTSLHYLATSTITSNAFQMSLYKDILKALIASGIDVDAKNGYRHTALDYGLNREKCILKIKYIMLYSHTSKKPIVNHDAHLINKIWNIYELQVKQLKKTFLGSSSVSFFEFLTEKDDNKLALYCSEKHFGMEAVMKSASYLKKFPKFAEDIKEQFKKGHRRAHYLFLSQNCMEWCTVCKILPREIIRKITEHLEIKDLEIFSNAFITKLREGCGKDFARQFVYRIPQVS